MTAPKTKVRGWRSVDFAIPKKREQPGKRVLLKYDHGLVVIGWWRPYGGPFMIECSTQPSGEIVAARPLPR